MRGDTYEGVPCVEVTHEPEPHHCEPRPCGRCGLPWVVELKGDRTLNGHVTYRHFYVPRCECWRLGTLGHVMAAMAAGEGR